jgi:hypothetical protein
MMTSTGKAPLWKNIFYFFPIQLMLVHIQRNFLLLFFWGLMTALLHGYVGEVLGIRYLFLTPEYQGSVSFTSFFIIGFALGGFISAFQISSYIINSRNFPFLATLSRPFFKYTLNNSVIPLAFTISYVIEIIRFQYRDELKEGINPYYFALALILGILAFNFIMYTYFFALSRDIKNFLKAGGEQRKKRRAANKTLKIRRRKREKDSPLEEQKEDKRSWPVETYLRHPFSIKFARSGDHYSKEVLDLVFKKNHFNSAIFQLIVMISLLTLGIFREVDVLQIPAAAAVFLTSTMFLLMAGFIRYVFGRWAIVFVVSIFLILNFLSSHRIITYTNYAYGLDYNKEPVFYDTDSLANNINSHKEIMEMDMRHHISILNKWKYKVQKGQKKKKKPKIIFVSCSGGGSKAAYWTIHSLQHADSLLQGELLKHTHFITGSSGGMIGATYLRELYRQNQQGTLGSYRAASQRENIGKDMLNQVMLTLSLNDMFIRSQRFTYENFSYPKDRGYAFERQMNENTGYILDRPLVTYRIAEAEAQIPLLVFAPTVINDGRRMIISAQPSSFYSYKIPQKEFDYHPKIDDVEFMRLFANHGADKLTLTTAIRMNATFPFMLPPVSLPTVPAVELMDAGIRDNYGITTSLKYIYTFREWINENTDGVILLEISDGLRYDYERAKNKKLISNLTEGLVMPLGGMIGNLVTSQVYNNEQFFYYVADGFNGKLQHIAFDMTDYNNKEVSMSLHLTQAEKKKILSSTELPWNKKAIRELAKALDVELKE